MSSGAGSGSCFASSTFLHLLQMPWRVSPTRNGRASACTAVSCPTAARLTASSASTAFAVEALLGKIVAKLKQNCGKIVAKRRRDT